MIAESLIAHRGCALLRPENTLAAMTLTQELGIGWVEIDANVLGDGTLIMFHDDVLDRLTPASGNLGEHTFDSVRDLDVGSHFSAEYRQERIPTLTQAVRHIRDLGLGLNLEVKVYPHFTPRQIVDGVIDVLDKKWKNFDKLIISSFSIEALRLLHEQRPRWQLGLLCDNIPDDWDSLADELDLVSIHCHYRAAARPKVEAIKARKLDIYCYTVNDAEEGQKLWSMGVDGLITDNPLLFKV